MEQVGTAVMVDRCRRHSGLDQLDPSTVDDLMVGRGGDSHGPSEMMRDAKTHAIESTSRHGWSPKRLSQLRHRSDAVRGGFASQRDIDVGPDW